MGDVIKEAIDFIVPMLSKRHIPFQITGGFAARLYGATRKVNDIDIDLNTADMELLLAELADYVVEPAGRCKDTTWDLYVCTLDVNGQLIDLSGNEEAYVHNKNTGAWDILEMNFDQVVWIEAYGYVLPIQNPIDLMNYKLKIKYDEAKHLEDVEAIRRYLSKFNSRAGLPM